MEAVQSCPSACLAASPMVQMLKRFVAFGSVALFCAGNAFAVDWVPIGMTHLGTAQLSVDRDSIVVGNPYRQAWTRIIDKGGLYERTLSLVRFNCALRTSAVLESRVYLRGGKPIPPVRFDQPEDTFPDVGSNVDAVLRAVCGFRPHVYHGRRH
jgi:hypothetical protein